MVASGRVREKVAEGGVEIGRKMSAGEVSGGRSCESRVSRQHGPNAHGWTYGVSWEKSSFSKRQLWSDSSAGWGGGWLSSDGAQRWRPFVDDRLRGWGVWDDSGAALLVRRIVVVH